MKVVVNAVSAHQGGIVTYTKSLIGYLPQAGADATIFAPIDFPGVPIPEGIEIKRASAGTYGILRRAVWEQAVWPAIVRDSGAQVLFSSANYGVFRPAIPQVLLIQGEISFNSVYRREILPRLSIFEQESFALRRRLVGLSARTADLVVFPSRTAMESVLDDYPDLRTKSVVNYLAVSDSFRHVRSTRSWRADGTLRLLYVSIYYPHKDPLTLQRAAGHLQRRGIPTIARISMEPGDFKTWSTGPTELTALLVAEQSGPVVTGRIHHTEVQSVMANHDVVVSPSIAETFGFPLVEAMAAGIPIVVADVPIHREICGDAALYFDPGCSHSLADRILELDSESTLRERCISRGRERVKESFTWQQHMSILVDCFRKVAK